MGILIDTVRIAGFRGIADLEINLPRVAVLIGPNNSGKTTVIKALQLALGDYARALSEDDFHIAQNDAQTKEILIDVRVVAVNAEGQRIQYFEEDWAAEFGDKIQSDSNAWQFFGIRTRVGPNLIKGGFDIIRSAMSAWPDKYAWKTAKIKETKMIGRVGSLPFIAMDAQRDIHSELKEKSSFIGRILSGIEYSDSDIKELEGLIKDINDEAISKSEALGVLKKHLDGLNGSIGGAGSAEITPFPKKIRDLSKHFSIHFGENAQHAFAIEYHGMGTRSWAAMLTVKAFIDLMAEKHAKEAELYFPVLAAEEPEAHLHPNAQRTLYRQLVETKGQVILSTHSPYLAAMANPHELRALAKTGVGITVSQLSTEIDSEDLRRLHREVIHSRGEIFFSKALLLCEGETEEQALPLLFKKYFGRETFEVGLSIIGVKGAGNYRPFLRFANAFLIPIFVLSDGEAGVVKALNKHYDEIFGVTDVNKDKRIVILDGSDFEGYLIEEGYVDVLEMAIEAEDGTAKISKWIKKRNGSAYSPEKTDKPPCKTCGQNIYEGPLRDYNGDEGRKRAIADVLDAGKTKYSPAIAAKLCELEVGKLPPKIIELFEKIRPEVAL